MWTGSSLSVPNVTTKHGKVWMRGSTCLTPQVCPSIQGKRVLNLLADTNREVYEVKIVPTQNREPHVVQGRQLVFHALFTEKREYNTIHAVTRDSRYSTETFPKPLAITLCHLLVPKSGKQADQKVVQYAPRYRLAFTLLNEDISAGAAPPGWAAGASVESAYGHAQGCKFAD